MELVTGNCSLSFFFLFKVLLLAGWLLFFPNAPYLITDVFHLQERNPVPLWFDLVLVISGAWNGLVLGILSLMQVENFLSTLFTRKTVQYSSMACILLCGYGVYIGRYWRYNSWDIIAQPISLLSASAKTVVHPFRNLELWAFTLAFSVMFYLIYITVKQLPLLIKDAGEKA